VRRCSHIERHSGVANTAALVLGCLGGVRMCLEYGCPDFIFFVVSLSPSKANAETVPQITACPFPSNSFPVY
jgi:hypothetical protein